MYYESRRASVLQPLGICFHPVPNSATQRKKEAKVIKQISVGSKPDHPVDEGKMPY